MVSALAASPSFRPANRTERFKPTSSASLEVSFGDSESLSRPCLASAAPVERLVLRLLCAQRRRPPPRRIPGSTARAGRSAHCSTGRSPTSSSASSASTRSASRRRTVTCRAVRAVRGVPKTPLVRLDDRAADRQAHPHALGLGREGRREDPVSLARADSGAGIRDRQGHGVAVARLRTDRQDSRLAPLRHRVDGVDDEVEKHLLQLDPVTGHDRDLLHRFHSHRNPMPLQLASAQSERLLLQLVDIERDPVA